MKIEPHSFHLFLIEIKILPLELQKEKKKATRRKQKIVTGKCVTIIINCVFYNSFAVCLYHFSHT